MGAGRVAIVLTGLACPGWFVCCEFLLADGAARLVHAVVSAISISNISSYYCWSHLPPGSASGVSVSESCVGGTSGRSAPMLSESCGEGTSGRSAPSHACGVVVCRD